VRWSLRERGVVLAGPAPATLVDPVSSEDLRAEALTAMQEAAAWASESVARYRGGDVLAFSRWKQRYLVLSFCRYLHTLDSGTVSSKREAGEWALWHLDSRWRRLIRRALDDRPRPWERVREPAEADAVAETMQFVDHAVGQTNERRTGRR
jgi:hypothetical protein